MEPVSIVLIIGVCGNLLFTYLINSRCTQIDACGCHIKRDVVATPREIGSNKIL